jgi:hypothetical protein
MAGIKMVGINDFKKLTRIQQILAATATAIVVFTITGFLILPPIIKHFLQKELTKELNRPTTVAKLGFNPYTLTLTASGLVIKERGGTADFVTFDKMAVNLEILSIFKLVPIINSLTLDGLHTNVIRGALRKARH